MKRIQLLFLLSILSLNLFCQYHWKRYTNNPVMTGIPGQWDEKYIVPVSVLFYDNIYHMYYSGQTDETYGFGYATSPDGITWTRDANNPIMVSGIEGEWDEGEIVDCHVVRLDTIFHMWYTGRTKNNYLYRIGHATSSDGIDWTKDPDNPIEEFIEGYPSNTYTFESPVVYDGDLFHLYYATGIWHGSKMKVNHAMSEDGFSWSLDPNNPILQAGDNEEYINPEAVVYNGNKYIMSYLNGYYNTYDFVFKIAISDDLFSWEEYEHNPVFTPGPAGSWEEWIGRATILYDSLENKFRMWYLGGDKQDSTIDIGYAESYEPAWMPMRSMNVAKGGSSSCLIDSSIYVFGGLDNNGQILSSAQVYETTTNEWSDLMPAPVDLTGSAGFIDDKIYLTGGWIKTESTWVISDSIFVYDPEANNWEPETKCPKKKGDHALCVWGNKLYLFGGLKDWPENDISGQKEVLVYDPEADTWDSIPDMLYDRALGAAVVVYDGQIYVFGGFMFSSLYDYNTEGTSLVGNAEKYDPVENSWTVLADMPVPVAGPISLVYKDKMYFFGGDSAFSRPKTTCTSLIQEYDPLTDQWQIMENMPFSRSGMTGQKVGNFAFILGGYPEDTRDISSALSEVWRFNLDSLKVWEPRCSGVKLSASELNLEVDNAALLSSTVLPYYLPDRSVTWASGNEDVATVSSGGLVTAVSNGEAAIIVTAVSGGCTASCSVRVGPTGIADRPDDHVRLYPNPANDIINIGIENTNSATIEIYNVSGRLVFSKEVNSKVEKIDVSGLSKGMYFVKVMQKNNVNIEKLIVY
jgi:N-acetylneuraminic acid mutarotase/predicted GH43/DUF377 family glycosyl hydrolase